MITTNATTIVMKSIKLFTHCNKYLKFIFLSYKRYQSYALWNNYNPSIISWLIKKTNVYYYLIIKVTKSAQHPNYTVTVSKNTYRLVK